MASSKISWESAFFWWGDGRVVIHIRVVHRIYYNVSKIKISNFKGQLLRNYACQTKGCFSQNVSERYKFHFDLGKPVLY